MRTRSANDDRPLGGRAYGRVPHLPGSAAGAGDRRVDGEAARRAVGPGRAGDAVWVQEKLDGTNVAVARTDAGLVALTRAGYRAADSARPQARLFDAWARHHTARFLAVLAPGERLVGEWLYLAHGTRYRLPHEPFVALDLLRGAERLPLAALRARLGSAFVLPALIAEGPHDPAALFAARAHASAHGALGPAEGLVYRVERAGRVDLVAKWVRPGYAGGAFFEADEAVLPNELLAEDAALLAGLVAGTPGGGTAT